MFETKKIVNKTKQSEKKTKKILITGNSLLLLKINQFFIKDPEPTVQTMDVWRKKN